MQQLNNHKIIILVPTNAECNALNKALRIKFHHESTQHYAILKVGTGKSAQLNLKKNFNRLNNALLILMGTAGALCDDLCAGDIVIPTHVINMKHKSYKMHYTNHPITVSNLKHKPCALLTGTQLVSTSDKKRELRLRYHADAVDMESYFLAMSCEENKSPLFIIKIIFDQVNESLYTTGNHYYLLSEEKSKLSSKFLRMNKNHSTKYRASIPLSQRDSQENQIQNYAQRLTYIGEIMAEILHNICIQKRNVLEFLIT